MDKINTLIKELKQELTKENDDKLKKVTRLWVRWNTKDITSDEFVAKVRKALKPEIDKAWRDYIKPMEADDPLAALLI